MFAYLFQQFGKKWWVWVFVISFCVAVVFICYFKAQRIRLFVTDYSGYLFAGYYFSDSIPLYERYYETVPPFLYLPFIALIFSIINLSKPEFSAFLFNLFNIVLLVLVFDTLFKILKEKIRDLNKILILLLLSLIFSARYLWTNFDLGQFNLLIVWLILLGFKNMLEQKDIPAVIFFTLATAIKIFPIVFLGWFFVRRFRFSNLLISVAIIFFILLLPFPFRGVQQSIADLIDFYTHVLRPNLFSHEVFYRFTNQSLNGALGRIFYPPYGDNTHVFPYLNIKPETGNFLILVVKILVSIPFIFYIFRQIRFKKLITLTELSLVFLFMHLISSLTWKNHLVSMTTILIPFFYILLHDRKLLKNPVIIFSFLLMIVLSLSGTSLIGKNNSIIVGSYSLYTILILWLYALYLYLTLAKPHHLTEI